MDMAKQRYSGLRMTSGMVPDVLGYNISLLHGSLILKLKILKEGFLQLKEGKECRGII